MYYVMDAHSFYNFIYFILLIIIGSFFMINLCLVVIATQFSETKQREHQLMQEQRAQCLSSSTLASMAEPGDCYEEIFQLVCHVLRKAKRRSAALYYQLRGKPPPAGGGRSNRRGGGNGNGERHHSRHPKSESEGRVNTLYMCVCDCLKVRVEYVLVPLKTLWRPDCFIHAHIMDGKSNETCSGHQRGVTTIVQGSYGHGKPGKVMEF
ncbi:Voltage-dependent T-type calcium channel subunit alpha-1I [Liparis tanakae]|uniref:Voltage-dependent T-type calcium channel subunit alpha-1I n=1 Tax=Liparis tanakae TaxID=230148 RepID=A0A4Z2GVJ9_9TELE|nr:Voltage-dependent T-type calcium channel subunit alpha-1I [Liparis tanakae]